MRGPTKLRHSKFAQLFPAENSEFSKFGHCVSLLRVYRLTSRSNTSSTLTLREFVAKEAMSVLHSSVTPGFLARNPKFAQLLDSLAENHLTADGVTKTVQSQLDEVCLV